MTWNFVNMHKTLIDIRLFIQAVSLTVDFVMKKLQVNSLTFFKVTFSLNWGHQVVKH